MLSDMKTSHGLFLLSLLLAPTLHAQTPAESAVAHAYQMEQQGQYIEVITSMRQLIESNTLHGRDLGRAWQVLALAQLDRGDFASAQSPLERAVAILKSSPDPSDYPVALTSLSDLYFLTRQPTTAIDLRQRALHLFEQLGDHREIALTCNRLATVYLQSGNKKLGRKYLDRALQEMQLAAGLNESDRADIYTDEAAFAHADRNWPVATQRLQQAIQLLRSQFGETYEGVGWDRILLGQVYTAAGNLPVAEREMQQGLTDLDQTVGRSSAHFLQAQIAYAGLLDKRGDHDAASRLRTAAEGGLSPSNRTSCYGCTISVDALR